MSGRAHGALAALLLIGALGGTAHGSTPGVALAGTTTFRTGDVSATTVVRLTRATTFAIDSLGTSPQVRINGAGRFGGVVMTRRPDARAGRQVVGVISFVWCWRAGCRTQPRDHTGVAPARATHAFVRGVAPRETDQARLYALAPGVWDVTVLADGAAQTVVLLLPGLKGTRALTAGRPAPGGVVVAQPTSTTAAIGPGLQSYGQTHAFGGHGGVLAMAMEVSSVGQVRSDYAACYHYGTPPTGTLAYAPGCPGAEQGESSYRIGSLSPQRDGFSVLATTDHPGLWSQGLWQVTALPPQDGRALLIWVEVP